MGIITFLKKRYNNHLVKRLNKLYKLSDDYCKIINSYDESIHSLCNQVSPLSISSLSSSQYGNFYFVEELTRQYDLYYYYKSLYSSSLAKIELLEEKVKNL